MEARKAKAGDACNRYCALECIVQCIAAVLIALERPELAGVPPAQLSSASCRVALKKAKVAFHPDKCHG
jgi:hypothetical protein